MNITGDFSVRAAKAMKALLGPEYNKEWSGPELAARLAAFSQGEVMRVPRCGGQTCKEIDAFIKRPGYRFSHYTWPNRT